MLRKSKKSCEPKVDQAKEKQSEQQTSEEAETQAGGGRDARGRFTKNNPGGPGNPHARFSAQMLTIARQTMTPEKMVAVFESIYIKTLAGDMSAAKLLLHYTIGKPATPRIRTGSRRGLIRKTP